MTLPQPFPSTILPPPPSPLMFGLINHFPPILSLIQKAIWWNLFRARVRPTENFEATILSTTGRTIFPGRIFSIRPPVVAQWLLDSKCFHLERKLNHSPPPFLPVRLEISHISLASSFPRRLLSSPSIAAFSRPVRASPPPPATAGDMSVLNSPPPRSRSTRSALY